MTFHKRLRLSGWLFILPFALSFLTFIVVPVFVSMYLSVMQFDLTNRDAIHFVGAQNYKDAFADDKFWMAMTVTLKFALWLVPSMLVGALTLALGMNAMHKGRHVVRAILFLPGMLNVAVVAVLWGWFYNLEFGLFNYALKSASLPPQPWLSDRSFAMGSIAMMSIWWGVGGTSVILLAALQQIPKPIIEAAVLDGAGRMALFSKITMPMIRQVMLFVVITNTIGAFQIFGQPFILTRGGPELSTRGMMQYIYEIAFNNYRMGYGAAMSWLLFAVIAVVAIVQYRLMRRNAA